MLCAPLLAWLFLSAAPSPALCRDDRKECEETCTLRFGTSIDDRPRLPGCFTSCELAERLCLEPSPPLPKRAPPEAAVSPPSRPLPALPSDGGTVLANPVDPPPGDAHRIPRVTPPGGKVGSKVPSR